AVTAVWLRGRRGRLVAPLLAVLVVLEAGAMFVLPELSAPRGGKVDTALVQWLEAHAGSRDGTGVGTGRVFTFGGLLNPDYGSDLGVAEADVNDLPMPRTYARDISRRLDPSTIPNHFDGTTIVHAARANPETPLETPLEAFASHMGAYEAIGVSYVAAYAGSADAAGLSALGLVRVYANPHAVVYRLPHPAPLYSVVGGGCTLSDEQVGSVVVDCSRPATLVRRELDMAGWSATVGSRPLAVHRHGPLFQEVALGRGRTVVRFSFLPPHEGAALWALVAGLVALVAGWALGTRRTT
ncbi:MAG: hypothetical protein ACRDV8_08850, partial [Acidimicrobiales bacterium]